jgi:hypothetical protein
MVDTSRQTLYVTLTNPGAVTARYGAADGLKRFAESRGSIRHVLGRFQPAREVTPRTKKAFRLVHRNS